MHSLGFTSSNRYSSIAKFLHGSKLFPITILVFISPGMNIHVFDGVKMPIPPLCRIFYEFSDSLSISLNTSSLLALTSLKSMASI